MKQQSKQYIGVSGPSSVHEATAVATVFESIGLSLDTHIMPMIGLQSSYRVLSDGFSEGNRRVPHIAELPLIVEALRDRAFTTIHYYTKEIDNLAGEIGSLMRKTKLAEHGGVGGFQFNLAAAPNPSQLDSIKRDNPEVKHILQIRPTTFPASMTNVEIAKKLRDEYHTVDYVILDASSGTGKEMDIHASVKMYEALRDNDTGVSVVFAGGFNANNAFMQASRLHEALNGLPFSTDAEGGLRFKLSASYGDDLLSLYMAGAYIDGVARVLLKND